MLLLVHMPLNRCRKGQKDRKIAIAKNLKAESVSVDVIVRTTGLTIEEIEELN